MTNSIAQMILFCRQHQADNAASVKARLNMAASWNTGTDRQWRAAAKMSGAKFVPKSERQRNALMDSKIAAKYAAEEMMYSAIADALDSIK